MTNNCRYEFILLVAHSNGQTLSGGNHNEETDKNGLKIVE